MRIIRKRNSGFSLIELLTVVAIIGILAGMTMVAVGAAKRRAHIAKAQGEVRELMRAWRGYYLTFNEWPSDLRNTTNALMDAGNLRYLLGVNDQNLHFLDAGPQAATKGMLDPWGEYYMVDFSQTQIPGEDVYEACVAFPLQRRYRYDDM